MARKSEKSKSNNDTNHHGISSVQRGKEDAGTTDLFICDLCSKQYRHKRSLRYHKRSTHYGQRNVYDSKFKCSYENCTWRFARIGALNNHLVTHTGEKNYKCNFCSKTFGRSTSLTIHMRIHTIEKPYECPVPGCSMCFPRKDLIDRHIWINHRHLTKLKENRQVEYSIKGYPTRTFTCLKSHHTNLKCYKKLCLFCGKYFVSLENHLRTHTNERPFKCQKCGYESKEAGTLKQHTARVHAEIKTTKLTCSICCGKNIETSFNLPIHLKQHMQRVHVNKERQLTEFTKCTVCSKKIITNGTKFTFRLVKHYKNKHNLDLALQVLLVRNCVSDEYFH